jgi:hypothetical protein
MTKGASASIVGIIALAIGLLIGRVALAPGPGEGEPPTMGHPPRDRNVLVVLVARSTGGCEAMKLDEHRAFRNDRVVWDVRDECGADNQLVQLRWRNSNSPSSDNASATIHGRRAKIQIRINQVPENEPGHENEVKEYPYDIYLNGTLLSDPKLEIDPFSGFRR